MAAVPAERGASCQTCELGLQAIRRDVAVKQTSSVLSHSLLAKVVRTKLTCPELINALLLHDDKKNDFFPKVNSSKLVSLIKKSTVDTKTALIDALLFHSNPTLRIQDPVRRISIPGIELNRIFSKNKIIVCPQHSVINGLSDVNVVISSKVNHLDREGPANSANNTTDTNTNTNSNSNSSNDSTESDPEEKKGISYIQLSSDSITNNTLVRSIDTLMLDLNSNDAAEVTVPPYRDDNTNAILVSKETDEDGKGMFQYSTPMYEKKVKFIGKSFDSRTAEDIHEWTELFASGIESPTFTRPGAVHFFKMASYLLSELKIDKFRLVSSMSLMMMSKVISAQVPEYLRAAVNTLKVKNNDPMVKTELTKHLGQYCILQAAQIVTAELQSTLFTELGEKTRRALMRKVFSHLHNLDFLFHSGRSSGCVCRIIERGSSAIQLTISALVFEFIPNVLELALMERMLRRNLGPVIAKTSTATLVLYTAWTLRLNHYSSREKQNVNRYDNIASGRLYDSLSNHQIVKLYNGTDTEIKRLDRAQQALGNASISYRKAISLTNIGQRLILTGGISLMLHQLASGVLRGQLTFGDLFLFKAYILQVRKPIEAMGFMYRKTRQGMTDLSNLFQLLTEVKPYITDPKNPQKLPIRVTQTKGGKGKNGRIEIKGVDYNYSRSSKMALKSLNLAIRAGESVGIVGESGSGKSTLSKLLSRLLEPTSGSIFIDGVDITKISLKSLRDELVVVPQEPLLFNDTIAYNIGYGRPKVGRYEIEDAAIKARIHDTIRSRPEGYHTIVGQSGVKLSGGERQRLSLARALLKNPRILIYDEATAALDPATELGVVSSILCLPHNPTSIIITHRLSSIRNVDRIVVLSGGRISESGTHEQLLRSNGRYAAMWNQQQGF